jgi:hypothetical protein
MKVFFLKLFIKVPYSILILAFTTLSSFFTRILILIEGISKYAKSYTIFQLVSIDQLEGFTKIAESHGGIEDIILPKIIGLSNGGSISVDMPGDYLCKLVNVSLVACSDFIRDKKGHVANEKLLRKEYDFLHPRDRDILEINGRNIRLSKKTVKIYSKIAFNLMGTFSLHWAHFLAQYYPKLAFLENLPKSDRIDLIIPINTDSHILYHIKHELKNYPHIYILEVDLETEIVCENLYHVVLGTFLADDGYFPTPFSVQISNSTINFWNKKASELVPHNSKKFRKLFIGRMGGRSLNNYNEILNYFIEKGFVEIFPHLLNIDEKIKIFSEAKYIVGPYSSGFFNTIYSQQGVKILAFINSYRFLDTYFSKYNKLKNNEFWFMTGKDNDIKTMNSNYEISLQNIISFINDVYFSDHESN